MVRGVLFGGYFIRTFTGFHTGIPRRAVGVAENFFGPSIRRAMELKRCSSVATRSCAECAPFKAPWGEQVQELCGRACPEGLCSQKASLAKISFEPGVFSRRHYHPEPTEEIFYVLRGVGTIEVGGASKFIQAGDTVLVPSNTPHQIGNPADAAETLETLVVCVPAWEPSNTVWLDGKTKVVQTADEARPQIEPTPWEPLSARRRAYVAASSPGVESQRSGFLATMSLIAAAAAGLALGLRVGRQ